MSTPALITRTSGGSTSSGNGLTPLCQRRLADLVVFATPRLPEDRVCENLQRIAVVLGAQKLDGELAPSQRYATATPVH